MACEIDLSQSTTPNLYLLHEQAVQEQYRLLSQYQSIVLCTPPRKILGFIDAVLHSCILSPIDNIQNYLFPYQSKPCHQNL